MPYLASAWARQPASGSVKGSQLEPHQERKEYGNLTYIYIHSRSTLIILEFAAHCTEITQALL